MGPEPTSLPTIFSPDSPPEVKQKKPAAAQQRASDAAGTQPPEPRRAAATTAAAPEAAGQADGLVPPGTVVRIFGLKSLPGLNGQLGQVLRSSENQERVVVQTHLGEKGLKLENLQHNLASVCPTGSGPMFILMIAITVASLAHITYSRSNGVLGSSTASLPVLAALWLIFTLSLVTHLHRPSWATGTWVPAIYSMGSSPQARLVFRFGFALSGALFLASNFVFAELIVPHIQDVHLPPLLIQNTSELRSEEDGKMAQVELDSHPDDALPADATGNKTIVPYYQSIAANSMVLSGYIAPAALALQGQFRYQGLSIYSSLYVASALAFVAAAFQHCTLSALLLSSPRAAAFVGSSEVLTLTVRLRKQLIDFAPLAVLAVPLVAQMFSRNSMGNRRSGTLSFKEALENTGFGASANAIQWGTLLVYCVFIGTHAVDFWVVSQMKEVNL